MEKTIKQFKPFILILLLILYGYVSISCSILSKYTAVQKSDFKQVMTQLDTPEKVTSWIAENITYDWGRMRANGTRQWSSFQQWWLFGIKSPIQTYYDKSGVCCDFANLAGYALHKAGYKVKIVTGKKYGGARGLDQHTVCAFKNEGKWWITGDSRYRYKWSVSGPFNNIKEIANFAVGGKAAEYDTSYRKGF